MGSAITCHSSRLELLSGNHRAANAWLPEDFRGTWGWEGRAAAGAAALLVIEERLLPVPILLLSARRFSQLCVFQCLLHWKGPELSQTDRLLRGKRRSPPLCCYRCRQGLKE